MSCRRDLRNRNLQADPSERPNILIEMRLVAVPADADADVVFGAKDLPDPGCRGRRMSRPSDDFRQPGRDRIGPLQLAQVIVVSEAERRDPPLAFKLAELKGLKRKGLGFPE